MGNAEPASDTQLDGKFHTKTNANLTKINSLSFTQGWTKRNVMWCSHIHANKIGIWLQWYEGFRFDSYVCLVVCWFYCFLFCFSLTFTSKHIMIPKKHMQNRTEQILNFCLKKTHSVCQRERTVRLSYKMNEWIDQKSENPTGKQKHPNKHSLRYDTKCTLRFSFSFSLCVQMCVRSTHKHRIVSIDWLTYWKSKICLSFCVALELSL